MADQFTAAGAESSGPCKRRGETVCARQFFKLVTPVPVGRRVPKQFINQRVSGQGGLPGGPTKTGEARRSGALVKRCWIVDTQGGDTEPRSQLAVLVWSSGQRAIAQIRPTV